MCTLTSPGSILDGKTESPHRGSEGIHVNSRVQGLKDDPSFSSAPAFYPVRALPRQLADAAAAAAIGLALRVLMRRGRCG